MNAQAQKIIPQLFETETEQRLIGSVIDNAPMFWRISEIVKSDDFHDQVHATIWLAIEQGMAKGAPIDVGSLSARLKPVFAKVMERDGFDAQEYLRHVVLAASAAADVVGWAKIIADLSRRRRLIAAAKDAIDRAYFDRETSPDEIADNAGEEIYDATHRQELGNGPELIHEAVRRAASEAEYARQNPYRARITTGLDILDQRLGGFAPRDLHVLGAASSMGKSGLTAQMILAATRKGYTSLLFSIEMSAEEVAMRYLAQDSGTPSHRLSDGKASAYDLERVADAIGSYQETPYYIDAASTLSVAQIRARCQAVRRRADALNLVVVDHLRLVRAADQRAPEHERIDQIVRDLKTIAKDLDVAVVLISPLNRDFMKRQSHRPILSDLYGSSAIEYHADHVWFLHREEFYLEREQPPETDQKAHAEWTKKSDAARGKAEIFGAKRRGGPLGSAIIGFEAPLVRFFELEPDNSNQESML